MKKVILSLLLVLACAGLKAQVAAFEKMGKIEGVEYQCLDKDTISQIFKESKKLSVDKLNIDVFGIEGIDNPKLFKKMSKVIQCVQVLSGENKDAAEKLKSEFEKFIAENKDWQLVTEGGDEDGEAMSIYSHSKKGGIFFVEKENGVYVVAVSAKIGFIEILQQMAKLLEE